MWKRIVCLGTIVISPFAAAAQLKVDPAASQVHFLAVGRPSMLRIKGEGAKPSGSLVPEGDSLKGELSVDLNELTTGISLRDRHMKEKYLESGKPENSKARLELPALPRSCLVVAPQAMEGKCEFEGVLRLHGKSARVKGNVVSHARAGGSSLHSEFPLKLSDFAIQVPSFAGVTVADEVQVSADIELREEP